MGGVLGKSTAHYPYDCIITPNPCALSTTSQTADWITARYCLGERWGGRGQTKPGPFISVIGWSQCRGGQNRQLPRDDLAEPTDNYVIYYHPFPPNHSEAIYWFSTLIQYQGDICVLIARSPWPWSKQDQKLKAINGVRKNLTTSQ